MVFENVLFAVICGLVAMIIGAISLWAFRRHDPMHFWAGIAVKPEEISDIPRYNRANGILWGVYAVFFVAAGIASLFSIKIGIIMVSLSCIPGVILLMVAYRVIYYRYRVRQ